MRVNVVIRYIGMVMQFIATFMLASAGVSLLNDYDSGFSPLLLSAFLTALLGLFPLLFVDRVEEIKTKEGYAIVVGSWLVACIVGMFPYLIWGGEFTPINAWFESVSGFTTTGASLLNDIEFLPRGMLFWRASSAWIGGIGVVMFALVILPSLGRSRHMLSNVEMSTIAKDNFHYRTKVITRILAFVYVGMTLITTLLLKYAGMNWFDALTHAMSACGTCGFSTKNLSIAFFDSAAIEAILMVAMTLAGIHFGVLYATITGRKNNIFRSTIVRTYIGMLVSVSVVIAISLFAEGEKLKFTGIPSFAPEHFRYIENADPMKFKQLAKGIDQLMDEGVAQLFTSSLNGRKIIGTVGALQFEVIQYRLEHEYGAKCRWEPISIHKACWIESDNEAQLADFKRRKHTNMAVDKHGRDVFLADTSYALALAQENFKDIRFKFTSEV